MNIQTSILSAVPAHAAFLFLDRRNDASPEAARAQLAALEASPHLVVGLGDTLLGALGAKIPGWRTLPRLDGEGVTMPVTPNDLMLRISGADPGEVLHRERELLATLSAFEIIDRVEGFLFRDSRDLTGYEDGTENPDLDEAPAVAFRSDAGPGVDGSSVVAVQRWLHDLDAFDAMGKETQDHTFGRERISNEELDEAPESAHVKRTAQEDFDPEAFIWRRSMPWRDHRGVGLVFVSFSATVDPFEALCQRMLGQDDGIVDGLFSFTRPVTGDVWWCPPVTGGKLDLRAL